MLTVNIPHVQFFSEQAMSFILELLFQGAPGADRLLFIYSSNKMNINMNLMFNEIRC